MNFRIDNDREKRVATGVQERLARGFVADIKSTSKYLGAN
jgi:hypothetical protein